MKFSNITFRVAEAAMFAIPACVFAFEITQGALSRQGTLFSPAVVLSFLVVPLFGIPGLVIAAKDPLHGHVARENRRMAVKTMIVLGLVTFVFTLIGFACWATPDVLFPRLDKSRWDALWSWLYVSVLGCVALATILIALGLASLLSGRNLFCRWSDEKEKNTVIDWTPNTLD